MKSALDDHYACLGLPLVASEAEIAIAYRRAVKLLNPDRFSPGDPRALKVTRIFAERVMPAYSLLRSPELRQDYLRDYQAAALPACRKIVRTTAYKILQTATSSYQLRTLYLQAHTRGCDELHLDVAKFVQHIVHLHQLNIAFCGFNQMAPWRLANMAVSRPAEPVGRDTDMQLHLARRLMHEGKIAQAMTILRSLQVAASQMALRHELLGHCYRMMGTSSLAKQEFRAALQLDPNHEGAITGLKKLEGF
jgi:curved DNA-binding protein CbpA